MTLWLLFPLACVAVAFLGGAGTFKSSFAVCDFSFSAAAFCSAAFVSSFVAMSFVAVVLLIF